MKNMIRGKHDKNRKRRHQQLHPDALALGLLADNADVVFNQVTHQAIVLNGRAYGFKGSAISTTASNGKAVHGYLLHPARVHFFKKSAVGHLSGLAGRGKVVHHGHEHGRDDKPHQQVFR
jgi:hypothetical protein